MPSKEKLKILTYEGLCLAKISVALNKNQLNIYIYNLIFFLLYVKIYEQELLYVMLTFSWCLVWILQHNWNLIIFYMGDIDTFILLWSSRIYNN